MGKVNDSSISKDLKTKFLVFEGDDDLLTWRFVGTQLADNKDQALRLFYPEGPASARPTVAVTETQWRPNLAKQREPRTSLSPLTMPDSIAAETEPEDESLADITRPTAERHEADALAV